jgi:hypothetical protein
LAKRKKPQKSRRLLGGNAADHGLQDFEGQECWACSVIQGQGRRSDRREAVRAGLIPRLESADRVLLSPSGVQARPTRSGGWKRSCGTLEVLSVASPSLQALCLGAKVSVQALEAWAGRGFKACSEKTLEGKEKPKSIGRRRGATRVDRERIRKGIKASK